MNSITKYTIVLIFGMVLLSKKKVIAVPTPSIQPPLNPVSIRVDNRGDGHYNSSRDGGARLHKGIDLECIKLQSIFSPIVGVLTRIAYPYADDRKYSGCEIVGTGIHEGFRVKMFYLVPENIGQTVSPGSSVGYAQAISEKYTGMKNHIHIELYYNNINIDPTPYFFQNLNT